MRRIYVLALLAVFLVPSVVSAAWWNPFSWSIFNREVPIVTTQEIEVVTPLPVVEKTPEIQKQVVQKSAPQQPAVNTAQNTAVDRQLEEALWYAQQAELADQALQQIFNQAQNQYNYQSEQRQRALKQLGKEAEDISEKLDEYNDAKEEIKESLRQEIEAAGGYVTESQLEARAIQKLKEMGIKMPEASPSRIPSAVCNDYSLSYSKNRSGTCSSHGGVMFWY